MEGSGHWEWRLWLWVWVCVPHILLQWIMAKKSFLSMTLDSRSLPVFFLWTVLHVSCNWIIFTIFDPGITMFIHMDEFSGPGCVWCQWVCGCVRASLPRVEWYLPLNSSQVCSGLPLTVSIAPWNLIKPHIPATCVSVWTFSSACKKRGSCVWTF